MALEEVVNASVDVVPDVFLQVGRIALWLQAIGIVVILWLIFQFISLFLSYRRKYHIKGIRGDLSRIEDKIDRLEKLIKKKK